MEVETLLLGDEPAHELNLTRSISINGVSNLEKEVSNFTLSGVTELGCFIPLGIHFLNGASHIAVSRDVKALSQERVTNLVQLISEGWAIFENNDINSLL